MNSLLDLLTGLMTLKKGPQDAPSLPVPLLMVYIFTGFAQLATIGVEGRPATLIVLGDAALVCVGLMIFLTVVQKQPRWPQTVTAFCLCGTFLNLLAIALFSLLPFGTVEQPNPLLVLASLLLMAWSATVGGSILRHAGEVPLALGIVLMVAFQIIVMSVLPLPSSAELYEQRQATAVVFISSDSIPG